MTYVRYMPARTKGISLLKLIELLEKLYVQHGVVRMTMNKIASGENDLYKITVTI